MRELSSPAILCARAARTHDLLELSPRRNAARHRSLAVLADPDRLRGVAGADRVPHRLHGAESIRIRPRARRFERCARGAIPDVAQDLLRISAEGGRTRLVQAQHAAAQRRAEQIAGHVDHAAVLADLGLAARAVSAERWMSALSSAVSARSREQVARAVDLALRD